GYIPQFTLGVHTYPREAQSQHLSGYSTRQLKRRTTGEEPHQVTKVVFDTNAKRLPFKTKYHPLRHECGKFPKLSKINEAGA
ncbi:hypothetical protein KI387_021204, partial [Taxus chinensis]